MTLLNTTLLSTPMSDLYSNTTIMGQNVIPVLVVVISLFVITRDTSVMKRLMLPVMLGWHFVGVSVGYTILSLGSLYMIVDTLSYQGLGQLVRINQMYGREVLRRTESTIKSLSEDARQYVDKNRIRKQARKDTLKALASSVLDSKTRRGLSNAIRTSSGREATQSGYDKLLQMKLNREVNLQKKMNLGAESYEKILASKFKREKGLANSISKGSKAYNALLSSKAKRENLLNKSITKGSKIYSDLIQDRVKRTKEFNKQMKIANKGWEKNLRLNLEGTMQKPWVQTALRIRKSKEKGKKPSVNVGNI